MATLEAKKHRDLIIMIMALGNVYLEKGLYAEAANRYHQLLAFKVANSRIYTNLSKAYIGLKRLDKQALEIYQKAIEYDPNNTEIYGTLATSFLNEGRQDSNAIQVYEMALEVDTPVFEKLANHLSSIYFRHNEFIKCKEITERLLTKSGYQSKALTLFVNSCWKTDKFNDAIIQLKKLIDNTENNTLLLKNLCITYLEKKFYGETKNQKQSFSYVDRHLIADYLNRIKHFDRLKDISLYLELKRFFSDKEYWGLLEPFTIENKQSKYVYQEQEEITESAESGQYLKPVAFNIQHEVIDKLTPINSLTGRSPGSHSSLTYEDFKKEGTAIFTDAENKADALQMPDQAEIMLAIAFSNFEQMHLKYGVDHVQLLRSKLNVILTDIIEKYKISYIFGVTNGLIILTNNVVAAAAIAVEILNKLNRYNYTTDSKDEIHLTLGIHHSRQALAENSEQSLKDFSTGLKVAIVSDKDLTTEDRHIYNKIFQKTDRIFLSGKAYREIKSANRFKMNTIGQFKLKYLKENLVVHEIAWRNPIDDLRFGYVKKLGRFDLIAELGNKGSIKVFKAKDAVLQRFVILKVLQSEAFNSLPSINQQKMDFYKQAKSQGQMSHPNIANIYEIDEDQELTYIAREYIEGVTVTEIFKNGEPFKPDRLIKIIYQICKGLQYSHRIGFCHLNLKPENIRVGLNDEIKLMDFRIPHPLFNDNENIKENYQQIYYMSPEQIQGSKVDSRSDIFALGVILYELVTQVHPFASKNIDDTIHAIFNKKPSPPSEMNKKIPKFCEAFILKCMAKNPDNRFQTVEQMVTLLKKTFENSLFSNFNYQLAQSRDSY